MSKKLSKQISLGIDPLTGKRIRKWIHADSKAGLRQAEKDAIAEYARNGTPCTITYKEYEQKWFDAYCLQLAPHTKSEYHGILKRNIPLHNKKMKDITRTDLQKIINENWEKPSVCSRYAQLMKRIYECAVSDGVCPKNIVCNLRLPKRHRITRRPLTENELSGIKKAEFDPLERFMMDILLQFGLRPQEAYALNKKSFDKKARTLTIDKAVGYDSGRPFLKGTKTGVTRILPVPDTFWPKIPTSNQFFYFTDESGQLLTAGQSLEFQHKIIDKINAAMGGTDNLRLTDMTFYNCRHHKASLLYYLPGVSIKKKAEYMGHSEQMFLQTYSHMMEDKEDTEVLRESVNL